MTERGCPLKVFLAGPQTHIKDFNSGRFDMVTDRLRTWGHQVFSPVEADRAAGFDWYGTAGDVADYENREGFELAEAMRRNLLWISAYAEGIALLPGWESSRGALIELSSALACGATVLEVHDTELTEIDVTVVHVAELVQNHRLVQA